MSKMPAFSRSDSRVSLKEVRRAALRGSLVESLKLAAARRTFSTPRPVPVRIQSVWAGAVEVKAKSATRARDWKMAGVLRLHFAVRFANGKVSLRMTVQNKFPDLVRVWLGRGDEWIAFL